MRWKFPVAVLGFLMMAGVHAQAQTQDNLYYNPQSSGGVPIYNNGTNAQPFPMEQVVAGRNAPSYDYNPVKPYGVDTGAGNSLTSDQIEMLRAQRNAAAQNFEAQYLASLQQQRMGQFGQVPQMGQLGQAGPIGQLGGGQLGQLGQLGMNAASQLPGNPFGQLYGGMTENGEKQAPRKRKVVYKEKNNPLIIPPRLFDPDQ